MAVDIQLFTFLNNLAGNSRLFDLVVIFFAKYSQYVLALLFLALLYHSRERVKIFWVSAISVVVARLGIVNIIRLFYHHPRPFLAFNVHQLIAENEKYSFPSGHSAFFFALAAAVYFYSKKWGIVFFIVSILMGISRVIAGVHYPFDILGGMVIGIAAAFATRYFVEKRTISAKTNLGRIDIKK